ncbi:MAG: ECF transporter S component [Clostridiales bacterium]|nr:ECF transporter S component [Clostridiales bacterium]
MSNLKKKISTHMNQKSRLAVRDMTTIAILAALAAILFMIEIPIVLFYKLDLSSLPVLLGTFALGPIQGLLIQAVKSLLGLLHSSSQGVGELADFIMGAAMLLPAGFIYRFVRNRKGAVLGMAVGTLVATVAGVLSNLFIMIPFYSVAFGMPVEMIVGMGAELIPAIDSEFKFVLLITAPFNIFKWVVISVLTGFAYKPLSPLLHGKGR